ncbi:cystatin-1-like [Stegodyphus dumicola]|uniref:cystatin-1-like n=1 Tax=Stegodyphus dumicola TaxID=202533 RepID=UPI0015A9E16C|nr:cystatin-1-like [Stegodyphus dumicola]
MKSIVIIFVAGLSVGLAAVMTGGWSRADTANSASTQKYAEFAVAKISEKLDSLFHMKLMEVLSSQKQVVSGMKYMFKMRIGATECEKGNNDVDLSNCEFKNCEAPMICKATVWDQPWKEDGTRLLNYSCESDESPC